MQRALLERNQFIDVMADTTRGGRTTHLLTRQRGGMHVESAVQARERHLMQAVHGLMQGLTEGPTRHRTWTSTMSQHGQPVSIYG